MLYVLSYEPYEYMAVEHHIFKVKFLFMFVLVDEGRLELSFLSELELLVLKDMSIKCKKAGTAIAKEVELKYRREGKYFDEILRGE